MAGLNHPRTKYSKEQVLEVVRLFNETLITYSDISAITEVKSATVHDILKGRSHQWATKDVDLVAKAEARKSPLKVYSPNNELVEAASIAELSRKTGVAYTTFNSLMKNKSGVSNGWGIIPHPKITLSSPDNITKTLTKPLAEEWLKTNNLSSFKIRRLLDKSCTTKCGWKSHFCENINNT